MKLASLSDAVDDAHNSATVTTVSPNAPQVHLDAQVLNNQRETHGADEPAEQWVTLKFTHAGLEHVVELAESDRLSGATSYYPAFVGVSIMNSLILVTIILLGFLI